jgi:hypothetical protein
VPGPDTKSRHRRRRSQRTRDNHRRVILCLQTRLARAAGNEQAGSLNGGASSRPKISLMDARPQPLKKEKYLIFKALHEPPLARTIDPAKKR